MAVPPSAKPLPLAAELMAQASRLGFDALGIAPVEQRLAEQRFLDWLNHDYHGEMSYMARHGLKRSRPDWLVPGTASVICARMNYWPGPAAEPEAVLRNPERGYLARYALGRDYHKVLRKRLEQLARWLTDRGGDEVRYRVFCDSAPVLEKPLAMRAGLGWVGKHTNLIARDVGSWFVLGEIYCNLPLPPTESATAHCGSCDRCIAVCPTQAIVAPFQLDARRCISYWTIEAWEPIPEALRPSFGNRIFGCDDCQLVCPWNRYARATSEADFLPRHGLDAPSLETLFAWDEETFLRRTEGSPIRRLTHVRWLRNLAVALGNGLPRETARESLRQRADHPSELVREPVRWALHRLYGKMPRL